MNPATANSTIRYTLDGSSPGPGSSLYDSDSGILIDTNCVLQAVAMRPGWTESSVIRDTFRLVLQARPVMGWVINRPKWDVWWDSVPHESYDGPVKLQLGSDMRDGEVRYTTDGSTPTRSSNLLVGDTLLVDTTTILKAVAYSTRWNKVRASPIFDLRLYLQSQTPTLSRMSRRPWDRADETWNSAVTLEFVSANSRDELRYTLDGTDQTRRSKLYVAGGIRIDTTSHLRIAAFSTESRGIYSSTPYDRKVILQVRPPEYTQSWEWAPFLYMVKGATSGARVHFTRDGSDPDATDSVFDAERMFGKYEDSATVRAIAIPADRRIPQSQARCRLLPTESRGKKAEQTCEKHIHGVMRSFTV